MKAMVYNMTDSIQQYQLDRLAYQVQSVPDSPDQVSFAIYQDHNGKRIANGIMQRGSTLHLQTISGQDIMWDPARGLFGIVHDFGDITWLSREAFRLAYMRLLAGVAPQPPKPPAPIPAAYGDW
jgi:hypothetical protein